MASEQGSGARKRRRPQREAFDRERFIGLLKAARSEAGKLSQQGLAERLTQLGIPTTVREVQNWERRGTPPGTYPTAYDLMGIIAVLQPRGGISYFADAFPGPWEKVEELEASRAFRRVLRVFAKEAGAAMERLANEPDAELLA